LRCSCEHRASASKIGKLIYEPDDHQLLNCTVVVFPDQCQDLCSDHHTGTVLVRRVSYSWREVRGVTRSRGIALALFTMSFECSASISTDRQKERTNRVGYCPHSN